MRNDLTSAGASTLAILGAGGHGRVVADCAIGAGWADVAFFDDNPSAHSQVKVRGTTNELFGTVRSFGGVIVAFGDNRLRLSVYRRLVDVGAAPISVVHPFAFVSNTATIGPGTVVIAGAVVNAGAQVGVACILNTGCSIDHDSVLADGVHVSPGARIAGEVNVGERTWIGIGASIRHQIVIGSDVIVGAGAAVVKNVPDGLRVVGVPARQM